MWRACSRFAGARYNHSALAWISQYFESKGEYRLCQPVNSPELRTMYIPVRARITLAIIAGIGVGTGAVAFAAMLSNHESEHVATVGAVGAALLAASVAALIAHLVGGFRDIKDDSDRPPH